jgi:hypothetical protein
LRKKTDESLRTCPFFLSIDLGEQRTLQRRTRRAAHGKGEMTGDGEGETGSLVRCTGNENRTIMQFCQLLNDGET